MNPIVRNIVAVVAGVIIGMIANMGLITISGSIIPPPEGVNPADMESIKENFHLFEAKHYLMPFLAHSMGSFFGALVAALIAVSHKMKFAIGLGLFTMLGPYVPLYVQYTSRRVTATTHSNNGKTACHHLLVGYA